MNRVALIILSLSLSSPVLAERVIEKEKTATIDCAKEPKVTINHGGGNYTFTGTCEKIQLRGPDNKLVIDTVRELAVVGNGNTATVDGVDKIAVNGAKNTITYRTPYMAKKTAVAAVGADNKITRTK